jgi:membrane-associated protein
MRKSVLAEDIHYRDRRPRLYEDERMDWLWSLKDLLHTFVDPEKLSLFVASHQHIIYPILFAIVFCETGLVVTPFLPGDSMLFAAGAVSAMGSLNPLWLFVLLSIAAIAGDTVNYWIGAYIGPRAFSGEIRFLKKEYLDRTHAFYEKYGGKTIIIARFVPIVRTFAPFVAGIGAMNYTKFIIYNVVGGIAWVAMFIFGGYWFGGHPLVKKNFSLVVLAIIVISVMPMVVEYLRSRRRAAV